MTRKTNPSPKFHASAENAHFPSMLSCAFMQPITLRGRAIACKIFRFARPKMRISLFFLFTNPYNPALTKRDCPALQNRSA